MNVLCRMKAEGASGSAMLDRSASDTRRAVSGSAPGPVGPRRHLGACVLQRCLAGRGDHGVPEGTGQRRLGRGPRPARLVAEAVVVAGEAVDDEPLEDGGVEARPRLGGQFVQRAAAILSRRSFRSARLHVRPGVGFSVARISPIVLRPVSAAAGACGAVALPSSEANPGLGRRARI